VSYCIDFGEWFLDHDEDMHIRVRLVHDGASIFGSGPKPMMVRSSQAKKGSPLGVQHLTRLQDAVTKAYAGALARDLIERPPNPESESID
jgi:hypothetical protein